MISPSISIFSSFAISSPFAGGTGMSSPWSSKRPRAEALDDRGDLDRLRALRALALLELHAHTLGERLIAVAGDAAVVNEEILRPVLRGDEAIPLHVVEPLDRSVSYEKTPPSLDHERKALSQTGLALAYSLRVAADRPDRGEA